VERKQESADHSDTLIKTNMQYIMTEYSASI